MHTGSGGRQAAVRKIPDRDGTVDKFAKCFQSSIQITLGELPQDLRGARSRVLGMRCRLRIQRRGRQHDRE